jgi:hypothetical protein
MERRVLVLCALSVAATLTGCGSGGGSNQSALGTSTTRPLVGTTTTRPQTTSSTTSAGHFIPGTTGTYEFLSPSSNISCEITYSPGAPESSAYCETNSPTQSVTMTADGTLKTCSGAECGSNAGVGTPTLAYGDSTGIGPFRCTSTVMGMVCTAVGGKGFKISTSGITPISS